MGFFVGFSEVALQAFAPASMAGLRHKLRHKKTPKEMASAGAFPFLNMRQLSRRIENQNFRPVFASDGGVKVAAQRDIARAITGGKDAPWGGREGDEGPIPFAAA